MAAQREKLEMLKQQVAMRRTQAQELLEEAVINERMQKRREKLLKGGGGFDGRAPCDGGLGTRGP